MLFDPRLNLLRPGKADISSMHTKKHTLPYKCTSAGCRWGRPGKGFYQLRDLRKHEKTHLGCPSFRCPVENCPSSATREDNMVRHLKDMHRIEVRQADIPSLCGR